MTRLCECGCGAVVARRFVRGHNWRGKPGAMLGRKHSMEARRKMSEAQKGRVFSPEHRRRISEAMTGRKRTLSPEHCRAISKGRTGIVVGPLTPEHRGAMRSDWLPACPWRPLRGVVAGRIGRG